MTLLREHNYIQNYEAGIEGLKADPHNRSLQHQVVLSLARAGALDLAIAEYERFGLLEVEGNEDIMSLNGRLSKDQYLRAPLPKRQAFAREAMEKYEAAFRQTQGYYSGINSATMALMADVPEATVLARVAAVEEILPEPDSLTPTDHYFIQATRAECALLKKDFTSTSLYLQAAIAFDPLNYAAHATTLKQFEMILEKRGTSKDWLTPFRPPRPVHFGGRMRLHLTDTQEDDLRTQAIDSIQRYDVGAGYGALAAGSDIILAEALLSEGAALHVVLPCPKDRFIEHSVRPFGVSWLERFETCLDRASSLKILAVDGPWPDEEINRVSGLVAMGQTILWGQSMRVQPAQILIWNANETTSYTATHAADWAKAGYTQITLKFPQAVKPSAEEAENETPPQQSLASSTIFALQRSGDGSTHKFKTVVEAVRTALNLRAEDPDAQVALDVHLSANHHSHLLQSMVERGSPQSLLASENFASLLAYSQGDRFKITFAGLVEDDTGGSFRCYAIDTTSTSDDRTP